MSDEEDLTTIRERSERATPGPWRWNGAAVVAGDDDYILWPANIPGGENLDAAAKLGACGLRAEPDATANMDFLAHARADVPALLAEIERLHTLITRDPSGGSPHVPDPEDGGLR